MALPAKQPSDFSNALLPGSTEAFEVQQLIDKLQMQLASGEQILATDSTIPFANKKAVLPVFGCSLVIAMGYFVNHKQYSLFLAFALLMAALWIWKFDTQLLTVWAVTNQHVISISTEGIKRYSLAKIRLYNPRVIGTDISFYLGRASMVKMARLREPEKTLGALVGAVNEARSLSDPTGKLAPIEIEKQTRLSKFRKHATTFGASAGAAYYLFVAGKALEASHAERVWFTYAFWGYTTLGAVVAYVASTIVPVLLSRGSLDAHHLRPSKRLKDQNSGGEIPQIATKD